MNFRKYIQKLDFVKHKNKFFVMTALYLIIGTIILLTAGLNTGIDFKSGTTIDILAESGITAEEITGELETLGLAADDLTFAGADNEIVRVVFVGGLSQQETLAVQNHFNDMYGSQPTENTVTPMVGEELAKNAIIATLIAMVGIIIYVTFRFEFTYGFAAIVGLFHDALFVLIIFSVFQVEVNIPFIAAILTVVGYSINDTIVTFDRIRENYKNAKRVKGYDDLAKIVNASLIQTLSRTVNTILTILFAAVALLIFGGEAIRGFSLALVLGLIAGTYSSLFIAAQLWLVMKSKQLDKKKHRPVEPVES